MLTKAHMGQKVNNLTNNIIVIIFYTMERKIKQHAHMPRTILKIQVIYRSRFHVLSSNYK